MRWVGVAVVAGVLLAGCGEPVDWTGRSYVALGDSATAAPGVGTSVGAVGCFQTDANYPRRVAEELDLELTDVSCSGATTADLEGSQRVPGGSVPPQFDALTEDTDLVTMRIGANDGFHGEVISTCLALADDPGDGPCTDHLEDEIELLAGRLALRLEGALAEIALRSPQALVVVVGYPQFVPDEPPEACPQFPLAPGDFGLARRLNELLNETLAEAAADAGAEYVDVFAATEGHDMCADDPWIAGENPTKPATPYHPYAEEQQATADRIVELLES